MCMNTFWTILLGNKQGELLLASILQKYIASFQGVIGCLPGPPLLELILENPDQTDIHLRPLQHSAAQLDGQGASRSRAHGKIRYLAPIFRSRWAALSMVLIKPNGGNVRVVTDFRGLDGGCLVRHPYPISKLGNLFHRRMEGFDYITALDISSGFHMFLSCRNNPKRCTPDLPWGKLAYPRCVPT